MTLEEKKTLISIALADSAPEEHRELASWLAPQLELVIEKMEHQPAEEEGKPKTPLPEDEETASPAEDDFDLGYLPDEEAQAERERRKSQRQGFLTGLVTAWFVIGIGSLTVLIGRKALGWLSILLGIPFDVLVGLLLLLILTSLLCRKTRDFAAKLADFLDPNF